MAITPGKDTFITCRNSQGMEFRATLLRLTRYMVVFEVYNPYSIVQLSEVLTDFRIIMNDRMVYSGRAVVRNLLNTGILLVCETTLEDSWLDIDVFPAARPSNWLEIEYSEFLKEWEKVRQVQPEFKVVVADIQTMLMDLRGWLEQVELSIRSEPGKDRLKMEIDVLEDLKRPIIPTVTDMFQQFEGIAARIEEDFQPVHRSYVKRQIHRLILCSPFIYRTFQKPMGYAGDYETVDMIFRPPYEGGSLFAKILNLYILSRAPAEAHRNRVKYMTEILEKETRRVASSNRKISIFNLGCGPAREVQNFLAGQDLSEEARFVLVDFNEETLFNTGKILEEVKKRHHRGTEIEMVKKSVHQVLKETLKNFSPGQERKYDVIYCAGLFDYLSDRICKRLMNIFYESLAPGGLLIATNVDPLNPIRYMMDYVLEWHLIYRNEAQFKLLAPDEAKPGEVSVKAEATKVNLFLEIRKPET
jgi:extracellular factor (EF) 3-hydroxypalmitic acid methyl ester biosynthesis protein